MLKNKKKNPDNKPNQFASAEKSERLVTTRCFCTAFSRSQIVAAHCKRSLLASFLPVPLGG